jgi:hypothetical protein
MPNRLLVVLAAAIIVGAPARALAHDLKATVKLLPEEIVVEAGFDDDTPAQGAHVTILKEDGTAIAMGKTDEKGVCRLAMLRPGQYTAKVYDLIGHGDVVPFEVPGPGFLDAPIEYVRDRPNKAIGFVLGVGGLLGLSLAFWWIRLRKRTS